MLSVSMRCSQIMRVFGNIILWIFEEGICTRQWHFKTTRDKLIEASEKRKQNMMAPEKKSKLNYI